MLGIGNLAKKVFGTPNDRKIKATRPLVDKINALEPEFEALSDEGLIAKTAEFKERVAKGCGQEVQDVNRLMKQLGKVSKTEVDGVISEFLNLVQKPAATINDPDKTAEYLQQILVKSHGKKAYGTNKPI